VARETYGLSAEAVAEVARAVAAGEPL
jgi:hypothetical protein